MVFTREPMALPADFANSVRGFFRERPAQLGPAISLRYAAVLASGTGERVLIYPFPLSATRVFFPLPTRNVGRCTVSSAIEKLKAGRMGIVLLMPMIVVAAIVLNRDHIVYLLCSWILVFDFTKSYYTREIRMGIILTIKRDENPRGYWATMVSYFCSLCFIAWWGVREFPY